MGFDDRAADAKSHAGPVTLGGKKRIEDLVRLMLRQPHTGIADREHQWCVFGALRLDGELAWPVHSLHRLDAGFL